MSKPFSAMLDAELFAEYEKWDSEIRAATSWGAALGFAAKCRAACGRELERRNIVLPSGDRPITTAFTFTTRVESA